MSDVAESDVPTFWWHTGTLYVCKRDMAARKWLSDSQSSKLLKGKFRKAADLEVPLAPKYSGGRAPSYVAYEDLQLLIKGCKSFHDAVAAEMQARVFSPPCGAHIFRL